MPLERPKLRKDWAQEHDEEMAPVATAFKFRQRAKISRSRRLDVVMVSFGLHQRGSPALFLTLLLP